MVGRARWPDWISMLDRKVLRDLAALRLQALAIALVIAAGVSVQLLSSGLMTSLSETRTAYYDQQKMADIWAPVVRAPLGVLSDLRTIDGLLAAEVRLRFPARLDVAGAGGLLPAEVISLPEAGEAAVNRTYLASGRMPSPGRADEALLLKRFAEANGISVGDEIAIILRGRKVTVSISGLATSPEHVYAIASGELVPDEKRYGVVWMNERPLSQIAGWEGAFNEAVFRVSAGSGLSGIIAEIDQRLFAFGAIGAYSREDQISDAFLTSEIDQLQTLGRVIPPVFMGVASVLVYVVIGRLVAVQRPAIGLLSAYGYRQSEILLHFGKLVAAIGAGGILLGVLLGIWFGRMMADLYIRYYDFPFLLFRAAASDYVRVVTFTGASVLGGGLLALRKVARLKPAEAMIPTPPADYSKAAGSAITRIRQIDQQTRMILRQIIRWPGRAAVTIGGVAASVALLMSVFSMMDGMDRMIETYFRLANRQDVTVTLTEPRGPGAFTLLEGTPNVLVAEPFRIVPARLYARGRTERVALTGVPRTAELSRLTDMKGHPISLPASGLLLSRDLAEKLGVKPGDLISIEVTEGRRPLITAKVMALAQTFVGSAAWMSIDDLRRHMGEGEVISGMHMRIDPKGEAEFREELTSAPGIASVTFLEPSEERLRALMDENIGISLSIFALFASMIAFGVVYNCVRISFTERQRELASLRVLGFSRAAVSYLLLGEVAVLTLLALPIGMGLGALLSWYFAQEMASELFRLPLVFAPSSMGAAALIVIVVVAVSGMIVRQRIDSLDMVEALKSV